jgi:hypothetical protein
MLRTFITTIILTTSLALASPPPNIATLSDLTINQAFSDSNRKSSYGGVVILVDNQYTQSESWDRSVWNDPEFAEELKLQRTSVVYITGESHPAIYALLSPRSTPAVYFWQQREIKSKRFGYSVDDTSERMLEWIKLARLNSSFSKEMIKQLKETPENIALRWELMNELNREKDETEIRRQFCWLFEHNELWYQFALQSDDVKSQDVENPEMSFRASLMWFIMAGRENLGLFKEMRPEFEGAQLRDGWEEALLFVDHEENHVEHEEDLRIYVNLRRTLESKRDNNIATDRDLFILKALTAEGDEARALVEEYQPYFK